MFSGIRASPFGVFWFFSSIPIYTKRCPFAKVHNLFYVIESTTITVFDTVKNIDSYELKLIQSE